LCGDVDTDKTMKRIILAALLALPTPAVAFDAAEALDLP